MILSAKKICLLIVTILLTLAAASSPLAGMWTHAAPSGKEEEHQWFYIKDDGSYARNEWIYDPAGTWYWLDESGRLPDTWGFDPAGYLYNSAGEYVDLSSNRRYLEKESFARLAEDMNYSQVISIMGLEHEILSYEESYDNTDLAIAWYSRDGESYAVAAFHNGLLSDYYIN